MSSSAKLTFDSRLSISGTGGRFNRATQDFILNKKEGELVMKILDVFIFEQSKNVGSEVDSSRCQAELEGRFSYHSD